MTATHLSKASAQWESMAHVGCIVFSAKDYVVVVTNELCLIPYPQWNLHSQAKNNSNFDMLNFVNNRCTCGNLHSFHSSSYVCRFYEDLL